jgi:hypothetical protein
MLQSEMHKAITVFLLLTAVVITTKAQINPQDLIFGVNGRVDLRELGIKPNAMQVDIDENIYLLGGQKILKLLPSGQVDTSFGVNGWLSLDLSNPRFALLEDNKLIVYSILSKAVVQRLLPDGSLDSSFGTDGTFS